MALIFLGESPGVAPRWGAFMWRGSATKIKAKSRGIDSIAFLDNASTWSPLPTSPCPSNRGATERRPRVSRGARCSFGRLSPYAGRLRATLPLQTVSEWCPRVGKSGVIPARSRHCEHADTVPHALLDFAAVVGPQRGGRGGGREGPQGGSHARAGHWRTSHTSGTCGKARDRVRSCESGDPRQAPDRRPRDFGSCASLR